MDVILDSNIIRRDLKLKDKNFDALVDYVKKTNSKIIIPSIVLKEVKGLYKRLLIEQLKDFSTSRKKLNSTLLSTSTPDFDFIKIDEEAEKYIEFILKKLEIEKSSIIDYKNEYLPDLVDRAIDRRKPLDGKGQQFRDGILWLTTLDYAESKDDKKVNLISDNPSDFGVKGGTNLSPELAKEAIDRGVEIKYFQTINDFIKNHASVIEFINEKWIEQNVNSDIVADLISGVIGEREEENIMEYLDLDSDQSTTGAINKTDHSNCQLLSFYVYEMADGVIFLNIEYQLELEYEIEIAETIQKDTSRMQARYITNPRTGEVDIDFDYVPDFDIDVDYSNKYEYPLIRGTIGIEIRNRSITDITLKDWDWG